MKPTPEPELFAQRRFDGRFKSTIRNPQSAMNLSPGAGPGTDSRTLPHRSAEVVCAGRTGSIRPSNPVRPVVLPPGEGRKRMLADRLTDADRLAFLNALDRADFEVTDWEAKFIETAMQQAGFSPKQRDVIESMICKYGERIGF